MNSAANSPLALDLSLAHELADIADAISLDRFRSNDLEISTKPDRTFVTDADQAVERAIRARIAEARPEDGILGEEYGTEGESTRQWIIDPIDGTANFLRGVPVWATLISLSIDGHPVLGVVSAPAMNSRWWAASGGGAFIQEGESEPRRLRVSGVQELADASISFNSIAQWDEAGYLEKLIELTRAVWRDRAYGDMWSYMLLAEGLIDVAGEFDVKPYDLAALVPIIEEAGGRFSSVTGEPGPWHGNALASNGLLHDAVLDALK
ncbi:histidinol-phosphatase [Microterricola viridarii]|uniref:Histidinol-phosphatase n=1 Tax=Microterricola viridarii TaxID=412690 RepID=A0A0Y0MDE6_9MICO|nr:histidinol-phosphatase [Microterricola viridarii]AMB58066.1 histidinol phosphatase [Microterricola viridarii]